MGGRASPERAELMGVQLAQMHRSLSPNGKYGFHVDNTIGGTYDRFVLYVASDTMRTGYEYRLRV